MNRNSNFNFALAPAIKQPRSRFNCDFRNRTSFNFGRLIPICRPIEILPGDSLDLDLSSVIRMPALVAPPMDNAYLDIYAFFVPNRLTWEHSKEFFGEASDQAWVPAVEYSTPMISAPAGGWNVGTLADYFGIPVGVGNFKVSALQARGYGLICQEFFRSTVVEDPLNIPLGDSDQSGSNGDNYITDVANLGMPFIACKAHDYFTSCTPAPQRGPNVTIPIGNIDVSTTGSMAGTAPVVTMGSLNSLDLFPQGVNDRPFTLDFMNSVGDTIRQSTSGSANYSHGVSIANNAYAPQINNSVNGPVEMGNTVTYGVPGNLAALIDKGSLTLNTVTNVAAGTINELRTAFQIQKFYERLTFGNRYREIVLSMFGVQSPDARMQIPEYLGGTRFEISIQQSVQNSESGTTPQGNVAGYSHTADISRGIIHKSFTEHGFVYILAVGRYKHSYCQGLERQWTRTDKFSYFWPLFQNLGDQAVYNREIYLQGSTVIDEDTNKPYDDEVFGYQERFSEYRYMPDMATGLMRPNVSNNLGIWDFTDNYEEMPYLSEDWLKEDSENIARIYAIQDMSTTHQLFADFSFKINFTRCMPVRSMPGFIDHH